MRTILDAAQQLQSHEDTQVKTLAQQILTAAQGIEE
jgi:hypothetical protein